MSNEAVKLDASLRREEFHENTYISQVKSSDGRSLESSREILEEFRSHFKARFARLPDLPVEQFNEYLADFPRLTDAAKCEGMVTEEEVREALKQVKRNKSPGLDGLPYELYLDMSHMFVHLLAQLFNHWFAQDSIPGQIKKGVIPLLKKREIALNLKIKV